MKLSQRYTIVSVPTRSAIPISKDHNGMGISLVSISFISLRLEVDVVVDVDDCKDDDANMGMVSVSG